MKIIVRVLENQKIDLFTKMKGIWRMEDFYQEKYKFYIKLLKKYGDHILEIASKECGKGVIFANGMNLETKKLAYWKFENGDEVCISNLALQQNLLRVLVGISRIVCTEKYELKAKQTIQYYYDNFQHSGGLIQWGGHRFVDYERLNVVGIRDKKGAVHELKECFPFYDLMFEVNQKSTGNFVRGFWNAHLLKWPSLEINRHGYYEIKESLLWANKFDSPQPFREASGLSFMNAGNDLIYAAGSLYKHTKENGALIWMMRMVRQYVKARNPETQLGAYQYNRARKLAETFLDEDTHSCFGDRAYRQLGEDFQEDALEGKIILTEQALSIYYHGAVIWSKLGKSIGPLGKELIEHARTGLKAFAKYAYKEEDNEFIPLLTNGTSLDGYVLKKNGYYGIKGEGLKRIKADERFLYSYVVVYCETLDKDLWKIVRQIGIGVGLGDFGEEPGQNVHIKLDINESSKEGALAAVELFKRFGNQEYLDLAIRIVDNMIETQYVEGFFINSKNSKYADFDSACPLVLLEICAIIQNTPGIIPEYMTGAAYIHGRYQQEDGTVLPFTTKELFR